MLIWRFPSNILVRSRNHIPDFREPPAVYEEDTCFNCGGECFIEYGSAEFGLTTERCPVCLAVGETFIARPDYTYEEWFKPGEFNYPLYRIPDGQVNWKPT